MFWPFCVCQPLSFTGRRFLESFVCVLRAVCSWRGLRRDRERARPLLPLLVHFFVGGAEYDRVNHVLLVPEC